MYPALNTRSRVNMADRNMESILGDRLNLVHSPQELDELRRTVLAEINAADTNFRNAQHQNNQSTPRRDAPYRPPHGPRSERPFRPSGPRGPYQPYGPRAPYRPSGPRAPWAPNSYAEFRFPPSGPRQNYPPSNLDHLEERGGDSPQWDNGAHNGRSFAEPPVTPTNNANTFRARDSPGQGNTSFIDQMFNSRNRSPTDNSIPGVNVSDWDRLNRAYDNTMAPPRDPQGNQAPPHNPQGNQSSMPQQNRPTDPQTPIWQFRGPELKPPTFTGRAEEYLEWKVAFRAQVDSYPAELRVTTLRDHIDPVTLSYLAYIQASELDAYEQCFRALDLKCCSGVPPEHLYSAKLIKLLNGTRASNLRELEHIFNTLNYTRTKLIAVGKEAQLELPLLGISNVLFGKSQSQVEKLIATGRLTTAGILTAIWEHMALLRVREQTSQLAPTPPARRSSSPQTTGSVRYANTAVPPPPATGRPPLTSGSSRTRSPSPNRRSFRCQLCELDDHSHLTCTRFSAPQQLEFCKERSLCFVCKSRGHRVQSCPTAHLLQCTRCVNRPPHSPIFCTLFNQ